MIYHYVATIYHTYTALSEGCSFYQAFKTVSSNHPYIVSFRVSAVMLNQFLHHILLFDHTAPPLGSKNITLSEQPYFNINFIKEPKDSGAKTEKFYLFSFPELTSQKVLSWF